MNNKGLTFIEVMMAVAIFGIMALTFTSAIGAFSKIDKQEVDRLQMMEIAREVTEVIKGVNISYNLSWDIKDIKEYIDILISDHDSKYPYYEIEYDFKEIVPSGRMLTVVVSDPEDSDRRCTLVSWLPNSSIITDPISTTNNMPSDKIQPSMWIDSRDRLANDKKFGWHFDMKQGAPDEVYKIISGVSVGAGMALYYLRMYTTFDFTINLYYDPRKFNSNNDTNKAGIVFIDDHTKIEYRALMGFSNKNQVTNLQLARRLPNQQHPTVIASKNFSPGIVAGKKYYLQTEVNGADVTINFGDYDQDNKKRLIDSLSSTITATTSQYKIGIIDCTSGSNNVIFSFPSSQGLGDDCDF